MIGADYFTTVAMPLLEGRPISATDDDRALPVAVVNETLARRLWPNETAIGRTFWWAGRQTTVVGVARDAKYGSLTETTPAFAYFAMAQRPASNRVLLIRSSLGLERLAPEVRAAVAALDPAAPRPALVGLVEANAIVLLPQRIAAIVTGTLGGVGLALATVGLYGVISYTVGRRTREIGLRVALGASRRQVVALVLRGGIRLALLGVGVGILVAASAARFLSGFLIGTSPYDPGTFASTSVILLAVAAVASYLPARRAARANPMDVLRLD